MALRVLIVDDNRDAADTLAALVALWGHTVAVAYDGEAGLRAAVDTVPDCLILDISMPRMDGYALARLVRGEEKLAGAKLMAVSALSDPGHARRAEEAGFDYRLTKPAEPAELQRLLQMIEHIVKLAEQTEQLARRNAAAAERTEALAGQTESLTGETKALLREVRDDLQEVKKDVQDVKQDMRDIKDELKDVKDKVDKQNDGEDWKASPGG